MGKERAANPESQCVMAVDTAVSAALRSLGSCRCCCRVLPLAVRLVVKFTARVF